MSCEYIFCPFCGSPEWISDKTGRYNSDPLEYYKCRLCKKFTYHVVMVKEKTPLGLEVFQRKIFSITVKIDKYMISVFYHNNSTQFQDEETREVILVLDQAVNFNWYKYEELIKKVKTYVVFS